MVATGWRDAPSAGLREREHPDDVDDLLRAYATNRWDGGHVPAAVGVSRSSGCLVRADLSREQKLPGVQMASGDGGERDPLQASAGLCL